MDRQMRDEVKAGIPAGGIPEGQADFYRRLRGRIRDWAEGKGKNHKYIEYILFAPDLFYLLCKLMLEPKIRPIDKALVGAGIGYFVFPFDLIPEGILGPMGYLDDVILAAYALSRLFNHNDPAVIIQYWPGEKDILQVIRQILKIAGVAVEKGMFKKIKDIVDSTFPDKEA